SSRRCVIMSTPFRLALSRKFSPCRLNCNKRFRARLPTTCWGFGRFLSLQCFAAELEIGIIYVGLDLETEAFHEFQHGAIFGQYQAVDFRQAFVAGAAPVFTTTSA